MESILFVILIWNSNDLWFDFFPVFQENVTWDELK